MPLLLKMPFSFRALNGVNTCVNMWVFVPLKVCQIFEVCQSVLLRDSHFVSITDLNLESMRRVCVCVSFTCFIELRALFFFSVAQMSSCCRPHFLGCSFL